ncbi:S41 family peptidase [Runella zeae]|uniref:S41 family peptidase n=1 Tax=Runella zeae TaxID=94255 RepID=UPI002353B6F0|nr:S41 family peptidase [Runella zeae]
MFKHFFVFFNLVFCLFLNGQEVTSPKPKFNFDFELLKKEAPVGWTEYGSSNYTLSLDTLCVKNGRYAACIEYKTGETDYKAWGFIIPHSYLGRTITLSGYIKTENIAEGFAGLWLRIDPEVGYIDMSPQKIMGTSDWTKYEIKLSLNPSKTTQILVGGMLVGKGKMWFDDLRINIDGKEIENLSPFFQKEYPAHKDRTFDEESQLKHLPTDKTTIENLKVLGLIWGFLKYYHPSVAQGKYNWDYELFRILPRLLNTTTSTQRDSVLVKWIDTLGNISTKKAKSPKASLLKISPDLDWIKEYNLSTALSSSLSKIQHAHRSNRHYYVELHSNTSHPNFKNESPYENMSYPDVGFRLLSLYRYWNIIQYYFPYKNLIQEDWKNVLEEFIPKFITANNNAEYTLTTLELIGRVGDTHATILGNNRALNHFFGNNYAPLEVTFVENKPIITGFYQTKPQTEHQVVIGDVITHVNDKPIEDIILQKSKYTPASNTPTQLRDIAQNLLRSNDSIIHFRILRNKIPIDVKTKLFALENIQISSKYYPKDTCFKYVDKGIAYLNNSTLKKGYLPRLIQEIKNSKGLIIDNRNYPTDFVLDDLCNFLMPTKRPFVKFTSGNILTPGLFTFSKPVSVGKKNKDFYKGKVVILINELSQSSSEFHAMAYRVAPNAIVLGSTTAAADGNVSKFFLPGGISTWISGIGVYYPDGKETQRIGILPDITLRPTIEGIKEGRDEIIEKAIEIIHKK